VCTLTTLLPLFVCDFCCSRFNGCRFISVVLERFVICRDSNRSRLFPAFLPMTSSCDDKRRGRWLKGWLRITWKGFFEGRLTWRSVEKKSRGKWDEERFFLSRVKGRVALHSVVVVTGRGRRGHTRRRTGGCGWWGCCTVEPACWPAIKCDCTCHRRIHPP